MTDVTGTWRMVRAIARDANGKELQPLYGGQPMGRLVLGANGRMVAVTSDGRGEIPAGEKREYGGYCGNYTYDGKQLITRVDGAVDPSRIGTDQVRGVSFENGLMVLRPPQWMIEGQLAQPEIYWEKIGDI